MEDVVRIPLRNRKRRRLLVLMIGGRERYTEILLASTFRSTDMGD
jgi:hypothetical protein